MQDAGVKNQETRTKKKMPDLKNLVAVQLDSWLLTLGSLFYSPRL